MTQEITLTQPDDWHIHIRDDLILQAVLPHTARVFARAIIMPNLKPPIATTEQALAYRKRILAAVPAGIDFSPLMTLYLTDNTQPEEIRKAKASGYIHAVKFYPAGATTNSAFGVRDLNQVDAVLNTMQQEGVPLLIHGEVVDKSVDIFDREAVFIEQHLIPLRQKFPELKIVLEHITTQQAVDYVLSQDDKIAATITPHHLLLNRNAMFEGGIQPHYYCLPIIKRETHRQALLQAATSGNSKFFLGTDSAPHLKQFKETSCGCAGIYSAHAALELYASVFEEQNALDKLEGFASFYGADFYGLPRNSNKVRLFKQPWQLPESISIGEDRLIPMFAGRTLEWSVCFVK